MRGGNTQILRLIPFCGAKRVPALAHILPLGIHGHNEGQLLNPKQPFDLLFTLDGGGHADEGS